MQFLLCWFLSESPWWLRPRGYRGKPWARFRSATYCTPKYIAYIWCYDVLDTSSIDYQTLRVERWMTSESIIFRDQTWPVMFQDTVLGQLKHLSLTGCENGPTEKLYHEILDRYDILWRFRHFPQKFPRISDLSPSDLGTFHHSTRFWRWRKRKTRSRDNSWFPQMSWLQLGKWDVK